MKNFKKEFKFTMAQNPGEIKLSDTEEKIVVRFDFIRQIFLERGL